MHLRRGHFSWVEPGFGRKERVWPHLKGAFGLLAATRQPAAHEAARCETFIELTRENRRARSRQMREEVASRLVTVPGKALVDS